MNPNPNVEMKTDEFFPISLALAAVLVAGGCATKTPVSPATSAGAPPPEPVPPPAPTTPAVPAVSEVLAKAAEMPPARFEEEGWESLFDGRSLNGWQVVDFAGRGEVQVESGIVVLPMGSPFTGIRYTNEFPSTNYEIAFDAMRVSGWDFFASLTVPVRESHCSLIVGGWGGGLVGISSIDHYDASENETTQFVDFAKGRWYRVRLRVTAARIEAWIDNEKLVNVDTTDRKISVRPGEIEECIPLGIASWQTSGAVRNIQWRSVSEPASRK